MRLSAKLLKWYDRHRRDLPWRAPPGARPDPYRVWLSEIMLQQTTVPTVAPYFHAFLARWPTVAALAAAALDDVLAAWAGLGYYARARNLHQCARAVAAAGGRFPETPSGLQALPGIGPYTAGAIAAIAFGVPVAAVDGNVERVIARLRGIEDPLPGARARVRDLSQELVPEDRPGDFAQALMDLGATVCTPRRPACDRCPWAPECVARRKGLAGDLPRKAPRPDRPLRHATAFWIADADGRVLLRRRPRSGLLGGMTEIPSTPWTDRPWTAAAARREAPVRARWERVPGVVTHGFTHFRIEFRLLRARLPRRPEGLDAGTFWCPFPELDRQALPTLMRKLARHALQHGHGAPDR